MLQWDEETLKLYYGENATFVDGALRVPGRPQPSVRAFLAVFEDGENVFHVYAPRVEISRGVAIDISDPESLDGSPPNIQPLAFSTNIWTYEVSEVSAYTPPAGDCSPNTLPLAVTRTSGKGEGTTGVSHYRGPRLIHYMRGPNHHGCFHS